MLTENCIDRMDGEIMASKKIPINTPHTCEFCKYCIRLNGKPYCPRLRIDVSKDEHCPMWKENDDDD